MNNKKLLEARQALSMLSEYELPVRVSLAIRRMTRSISHLAEDVEEERKKIVDRCVRKDAEGAYLTKVLSGRTVYDPGDNRERFEKELKELMNLEAAGQPASVDASHFGDCNLPSSLLVVLGELVRNDLFDTTSSAKPITLARGEWYVARDALYALAAYNLPIVVGLRIREALGVLDAEYEVRRKLINTYALKDELGDPIVTRQGDRGTYDFGENKQVFMDEDRRLSEEDVTLSVVPVLAGELPVNLSIKTQTLIDLGEMLIDES